jgi:hypothetical protein
MYRHAVLLSDLKLNTTLKGGGKKKKEFLAHHGTYSRCCNTLLIVVTWSYRENRVGEPIMVCEVPRCELHRSSRIAIERENFIGEIRPVRLHRGHTTRAVAPSSCNRWCQRNKIEIENIKEPFCLSGPVFDGQPYKTLGSKNTHFQIHNHLILCNPAGKKHKIYFWTRSSTSRSNV